MLFVVRIIVRFSQRDSGKFWQPLNFGLAGQGSYDTSMVLLQPSLADKVLDTRCISKVKAFCFIHLEPEKRPKGISRHALRGLSGSFLQIPDRFFVLVLSLKQFLMLCRSY